MNPELQALLDQINGIAELDDAAVTSLETELVTAFAEARVDSPSQDELTTMITLRDAVASTRAVRVEREAAAAERAAEAAALIAEIDGATADAEAEVETEVEIPAVDEPEVAPVAAEAEAEVPSVVAEAEAVVAEIPAEVEQPLAVAAAAAPAKPARPAIAKIASNRPATLAPHREAQRTPQVITAGADLQGWSVGARFSDLDDVAVAMNQRFEDIRGASGNGEKVRVASVKADFPVERLLNADESAERTMERIREVTEPKAIVAAGGLCAPVEPYYGLANISGASRPVRDSLAQFAATRGGINFITPPKITDLAAGVGAWTVANDANPSAPTTKARVTVACGTPTTVTADAITQRVKFGNFAARTFPEQVRVWMDLAAAQHARFAETRILTQIGAGSTAVTGGVLLGAARDILTHLDRAAAGIRSRHRTAPNFPLRVILPEWVHGLIRSDLTNELPGSSVERLNTANAYIETFFAARNLNVTWALDGVAGQVFDVQTAAPLLDWPFTVVTYMFPEGTWLFLDGGTLDLGLVRDSTLNSTNDFEMFFESFENVANIGVESLKLTLNVCPDGSTSGTRAIAPCGTQPGS